MRIKERIPIILKALENKENREKLLEYWLKPPKGTQMRIGMPYYDIPDILKMWDKHLDLKEIKEYWKTNPDLRLPQVLINLGYMQNYPGTYYYKEDEESMIESGILQPREILFWNNNYDKNGELLKETKWLLVKDINTDHIETILKLVNKDMPINPLYKKVFKEELKIRKNE